MRCCRPRRTPAAQGQLRLLAGNLPVYLFSLRDEAQQLLAILAVVCRAGGRAGSQDPRFQLRLLAARAGLECVRRDLIAHATIEELNQTVGGLDKDLNLLLAQGATEPAIANADGASELQDLLQQTIDICMR